MADQKTYSQIEMKKKDSDYFMKSTKITFSLDLQFSKS